MIISSCVVVYLYYKIECQSGIDERMPKHSMLVIIIIKITKSTINLKNSFNKRKLLN